MKRLLFALLAVLCLASCSLTPDDGIRAGYPAKVLSVSARERHTGKHGPSVIVLYLETQKVDCSKCHKGSHRVEVWFWRGAQVGDRFTWQGEDHESVVTAKRYATDYAYADGYDLYLKVYQCVPGAKYCWTVDVEVNAQTWLDYNNGDTIWFKGDKGEVVSS